MVSWNLEKFSSARWCHPFLRGCKPGLVRNRPLNGCWAGSFFFTSSLFSSLCSRGATLLPSCSDLSITFQSWNQPFLLADPQNGALQLQVIPDSMSSKRLSRILLHILWKGFPAEPFMHWWAGQEQGWKSKMDAETHKVNQKLSLTIVREWLWWAPLNIHIWFSSVTSCTRHYVEVCILCMTITWALHVEEIFKRRGWKLDEEQSLSWDRK